MNRPRRLLVFRFSALGDIAMTVPVIRLVLQQHPHLQITYVSTPFAAPLFAGIDRLHFFAADFKNQYRGVTGLYHLHGHLSKNIDFDAIADLHNVLRTKLLRLIFAPSFKKIAVLDKGRAQKKELTRLRNKHLHPLPTMFERYASVFESLALPVDLQQSLPDASSVAPNSLQALKAEGYQLIGVAPFAKHAEKTYPLPKMMEVVKLLAATPRVKVFLFGGKEEALTLDSWAHDLQGVTSLAGEMNFAEELAYIRSLHVMVSMDSANIHLASLFAVPVVSVWGSTHPYSGFYGWKQSPHLAVQIDLYCRPCSVFGNKPCFRGDLACLHSISPVTIYDRVMQELATDR